ncbi:MULTISPECIES: helix-turn-helix transcriptional regulator [Vibrio]|uniref:helix-turn-helix transcriptional regulator n=1 Tax=Vibrio TaxID=662 RepID=UPI001D166101|nr:MULTISPECIES: WYL domain-containing protein [Vibrio]EHR0919802.1 WYL domain-containing protein [Vibrio parahaemolyticus]EHV9683729.1 WYL domain-containing protein [Vibrio parahaemolyticus]EIA1623983.1 WYL domain-containing protein [Vibrio parahaemolyticus]EIV8634854.1 WYL domain-containing protein [Vibrio parahaemolyticus]EIZ1447306.1 WYL domain-containing protein [Vibrio parahaemolyticus]
MARRASTQETLALSFEMLKRIPQSHQVTASELHQQLKEVGIERDIRSIQRNLEMLCEHFDIVRDDRSKPYGYSWNKVNTGFSLAKLSPQESMLLSLAEDYLSNLLPANVLSSLSSFFDEAKYNLIPTDSSNKERDWLKKVRVVSETQPLLSPKIHPDVFRAVSDALYNDRFLTLDYHNNKQEQRSATVMPLGLAQQGSRLYLVCRFEGYDNERSLALHRIHKAYVSAFNFKRPKEFKLSQYDADGRFGFGEGENCRIQFCISKDSGFHLLETPLSEDQQVEEHDDHFRISATVIDSRLLEKWLRGFGEQVWDISPKKILHHKY